MTLRNIGKSTVTIEYGPPLFDVYYCTPEGCFRWSDGKYFILIVLSLTLEPGESYTEALQWNLYQFVNGTYYPPEPGTYYLWGICSSAGVTTSSPIAVTLVEPAIPAIIDVHPSTLNLRSKGQWITACIELPEDYEVNDIDVETILLNDTFSVDFSAPTQIGDHDMDRVSDMMIKFNRAQLDSYIYHVLDIRYGQVTLKITGQLFDGTPFEGSDTISVNYAGDLNNDGTVNILDGGILNVNWGQTVP